MMTTENVVGIQTRAMTDAQAWMMELKEIWAATKKESKAQIQQQDK